VADLFNRGNPVTTQTASDGSVSVVDSAKQATQSYFDGLGNLTFNPLAPATPVKSDKPIVDPNTGIITYPNGDVKYVNGDLIKANGDIIREGTTYKTDGTRIFSDGVIEKPNGDFVFPPGYKADLAVSSTGRGLGQGLLSSDRATVELIANTPTAADIDKLLKDNPTPPAADPYAKTLSAIADFFTKPDPQTTNPAKSVVNGLIALREDFVNSVVEIAHAAQQFAKDPVGNTIDGVKGTGQSIAENFSNTIDGWKWVFTTDPKVVADSAKIYFDDVAKQELAKAEENPGAYAFRKARDVYTALLLDLIGGGAGTATKTAKVADELGDAAKLGNKIEDAVQPTKNVEPNSNLGAINDTKNVQVSQDANKGTLDLGSESFKSIDDLPSIDSRTSQRMLDDPLFHDFPRSVDVDIFNRPASVIRADGRQEFLAPGNINGTDGVFHITSDASQAIVHRNFIPASDWDRYSNRWKLPKINEIKP
jgi:hypothetical protein